MNVAAKRQAVILTPEQVAKIAIEIRPQLKAAVLIGVWCGLRWGEMTELRRRDVTPDGSAISVGRGVTHRAGKCHILTPKGGKPRTVHVPPKFAPDVADHLAHHVADPDALLFPGALTACNHMPDCTFRDHFRAACRSVGITENVRIHDMRHTAATTAARFASLAEVQARLGHSTVNAAMRYQHAAQSRDAELAAALSAHAEMTQTTG
jgi:integrase